MLDSWAWIAYLQSDERAVPVRTLVEGTASVFISTINLAEIACFLLRHQKEELLQFVKDRSHVLPVTEAVAERGAALKHAHKFGLADALILATAREHKLRLVTGDPDFKGMEEIEYLGV